ncbi:MAG TPA: type VI secretion system accessory protein TagJ [Roseomonas sp.]|jgi:type VI secretion system protein ImpE
MTTAGEAFTKGDIEGAVAAATAAVKAAPRDSGARWVLAEMLLYAGEVERADRTLDAVIMEEPSPAVLEFRRLLRAEEWRRQTFADGRLPKFQGDEATEAQKAVMQALVQFRAGDLAGANAATAEAENLRPRTPGKHGDVAFDDLRDADDMFSPILEVITAGGDYMWVPVERLRSLEFDAPRRPRDLYWRRATIETKEGTEGVVYLPALYPWTAKDAPAEFRLGRGTDWTDPAQGPVRGLGQRLLLVGEDAIPLAEVTSLTFAD